MKESLGVLLCSGAAQGHVGGRVSDIIGVGGSRVSRFLKVWGKATEGRGSGL